MIIFQNLTFGGNFTYVKPDLPPPPANYLWAWGSNQFGRLGLGNTTYYSSPKQVGALGTWDNVYPSNEFKGRTFGIDTSNKLWAWGRNYTDAALGLGDTLDRSSPTQIGTLTNWSTIDSGYMHTTAIKTDGTIWSWGNNYNGKLGLGNTTYYSSPKQIGSLTNWLKISCGNYYNLAIKTDNTLWSWGQTTNGAGWLGLGNGTSRSSPVQIGALTTWASTSGGYDHSFAITTRGALWAWGKNGQGQLGLGDKNDNYSPNQIGSLTNWSSVSAGSRQWTAAIKTDGTLWAWGNGGYGNLGLGNTTSYSSPKQVGSLTTWLQASAGGYHMAAIKTDGTIWSWGRNSSGQLGDGTTTARSSPIQVGASTNWTKIAAGFRHTTAISLN
jgi:alpha-tubulin suppressor-like RCC1 family protein